MRVETEDTFSSQSTLVLDGVNAYQARCLRLSSRLMLSDLEMLVGWIT
jgi:hypothetical protein